jgi:DNA-binding response OmpR family regulator
MSARILFVEDEAKVASIIKKGLEENTFSVMIAFDGQMGLRRPLLITDIIDSSLLLLQKSYNNP